MQQWGHKGEKPGEFYFPIALAINAADEIFVTDHLNNRVQKFDKNGRLLAHFSVLPNPAAIALDKSGNIFLTHFHASGRSKDKSGNRVSVYSPNGRLLRQWGQSGTGDGEFDCPGGIAVAKDGVPISVPTCVREKSASPVRRRLVAIQNQPKGGSRVW